MIPSLAACLEFPTLTPSAVVSGTPPVSSERLIMGMLMEFAAQTAAKGTSLPTRGGRFLTRALRPRAVPSAPPVAARYEVARVVWLMGESPDLE